MVREALAILAPRTGSPTRSEPLPVRAALVGFGQGAAMKRDQTGGEEAAGLGAGDVEANGEQGVEANGGLGGRDLAENGQSDSQVRGHGQGRL